MREDSERPAGWLVFVESNTTGTGRLFAAAAHARGLTPVLLTADETRYPYVAQDGVQFVRLDTGSTTALREACATLAERAPVAGVLSSSEYFIAAAAELAADLGLSGPSPEAVLRCRDKSAQLAAVGDAVRAPRYQECLTVEEAARAATAFGGDVVVKPVKGSGSEGVRACRSPEEAQRWAAELLARTHDERGTPMEARVLVQELVEGPEYSVEVLDGRAVGVTAKHLGPAPHFVETGHDFPAPIAASRAAELADTARKAVAVLGLTTGPAHVELRMSAAGPVLIEVNPRLAGGMIPQLLKLATGFDVIAAVVAAAAGRPVPRGETAAHHASIRFVTLPGAGTVEEVAGVAEADATPGVVEVACTARAGETRTLHHSFRDRVGHVIALAETAREAAAAAETARDVIRLRITAARAETVSGGTR